jgi:26S proteasome regulatory subunit T2
MFTNFVVFVCIDVLLCQNERAKMEELRGTPMSVGTLEEIIDDTHAIVSSTNGPEYYVTIMSFVNQDLLEVGSSVLLHNKTSSVVGFLADDADPMVSVMKVEKAPSESYADIGGLHDQVFRFVSFLTFLTSILRSKRSRRPWSCL